MDTLARVVRGLLVALAIGATIPPAKASPIRYIFTDLGSTTGVGLTNDGQVSDAWIRTILGLIRPGDSPHYTGATTLTPFDGALDGRLLVEAYGLGVPTRHFIYDPRPMFPYGTFYSIGEGNSLEQVRMYDMNALGDVVGVALAGTPKGFPFLYRGDTGELINVRGLLPSDLGWSSIGVYAINDYGQILGSGYAPEGQYHQFLLTPDTVPEPTTLTLGALVLVAAGLRHMQNRRRNSS